MADRVEIAGGALFGCEHRVDGGFLRSLRPNGCGEEKRDEEQSPNFQATSMAGSLDCSGKDARITERRIEKQMPRGLRPTG